MCMKFAIVPHVSVGQIEFGMSRENVRALFDTPPIENSHPMVEVPSDEWDTHGIRVDYSPDGKCEAVLLVGPGAEPTFMGRSLLELPHGDLCTWIKEADHDAGFPQEGEESLVSYKFGFMLGSPRTDDAEDFKRAMAVFVWETGYWDD